MAHRNSSIYKIINKSAGMALGICWNSAWNLLECWNLPEWPLESAGMSESAGIALGIRRNDIFRQIPADSNIFHSDSVGIHRNDIFPRIPADCSESGGFHRNPWGRVKYCIVKSNGVELLRCQIYIYYDQISNVVP
jgi:hypothetical protein